MAIFDQPITTINRVWSLFRTPTSCRSGRLGHDLTFSDRAAPQDRPTRQDYRSKSSEKLNSYSSNRTPLVLSSKNSLALSASGKCLAIICEVHTRRGTSPHCSRIA
jgi:hypothetical protein